MTDAQLTRWVKENYDKYNDLYFDGVLPNINAKVIKTRKKVAQASFKVNIVDNTLYDYEIGFSKYYELTEKERTNTLLHEMIHIADYYHYPEHFWNGKYKVKYDAHGPIFFQKEAQRLKQYGWDIEKYVDRKKGEVTESEWAKKKLAQPYYLILFEQYDENKWWIMKVAKNRVKEIYNLYKNNDKQNIVVETHYSGLLKSKCTYKSHYIGSQEYVDKILNDSSSKILETY